MKPMVLAAVLAGLLGSCLTLLLAPRIRPAWAPPADPAVAELRAALEASRTEIAVLRARMEEWKAAGGGAGVGVPPVPAAGGAEGPPGEVPPQETVAAPAVPEAAPPAEAVEQVEEESEDRVLARESALRRSAAVLERLQEVRAWDRSNEVRQRWILASEEAVLAGFGKPDEIWVQDRGVETWIYRVPTGTVDEEGRAEWDDMTLDLNRGRLIRASE